MKRLGAVLLLLCLAMATFGFGNVTSAKASNYLTAEQQLDEYEHNVFDAVIKMLEWSCNHVPLNYQVEQIEAGNLYLFDGIPSEYRIYELSYDGRDNAVDLAFIRFVRIGDDGGIVEPYFLMRTEDYEGTEEQQKSDRLNALNALDGEPFNFQDHICGHSGEYEMIQFNAEGEEIMAKTQGASYINRINRALDEYWEAQ